MMLLFIIFFYFFLLMEVNNFILIFEKCTGYLLLVLTMLHLGQIVKIYLTITTYHMSKGKKKYIAYANACCKLFLKSCDKDSV